VLPAEEASPSGGGDPLAVLRRLEERLDAASDAAERLLGDAVRQGAGQLLGEPGGAGSQRVPPMGWQAAGAGGHGAGGAAGAGGHGAGGADGPAPPSLADADLLLALLTGVRDRIPPELQRRLTEALREVLLALRALIDWYLQRTERPASRDDGIEDIPIL
jgi:hypothetical protein